MSMTAISSASNALFRSLKALDTAKGRREQGLFIAEGPHLVDEAFMAAADTRYLAVREDSVFENAVRMHDAEAEGAEVLLLPPKLFNALAGTETPQGVLAVLGIPKRSLQDVLAPESRIAVVLERLQDPGNLGTVLRTALAVGAGFAVFTQDCADPWSPKVVRASQGAVLRLPLVETPDIVETVYALNERGWHTACGLLGGSNFFERGKRSKTAVVIGNEASGVSEPLAKACSARYALPMPGGAESLNAAVAAGIMLYDVWRELN